MVDRSPDAADLRAVGRADIGPDDGRTAPEARYEQFVRANLRRNYAAHYLHGMLGMTGFRLVNAPTFMPAYLQLLSGSDILVGTGLALRQFGAVVSPLIGASFIEHRRQVLPVAMTLGTLMRLQVLGLALAGWCLGGAWQLAAILLFLFLLGVFTGPQQVAFQLLLAKVIPLERRGRLQAWRNMTGGLIAAALAWGAGHYLIEQKVLGNGYSTTFLLAFMLTSLGLLALRLLMREPEPPTVRPRTALRERLRDLPALVRGTPDFRAFLVAHSLAVAGRLAAPFYILYASAAVGLSGATLGLLSLAYLGADTLANLAWGYAGDRVGFRPVYVVALILSIAATVLLMQADDLATIAVAFVGLGAAMSGQLMSAQTLVLGFGHRDDLAMRLALLGTFEGLLAAIGPLAAGLIATTLGYPILFAASIALSGFALLPLLRARGALNDALSGS
jgi:MFS family permease